MVIPTSRGVLLSVPCFTSRAVHAPAPHPSPPGRFVARANSLSIRRNTSPQSPGCFCRNSRIVGYQGESSRSSIRRKEKVSKIAFAPYPCPRCGPGSRNGKSFPFHPTPTNALDQYCQLARVNPNSDRAGVGSRIVGRPRVALANPPPRPLNAPKCTKMQHSNAFSARANDAFVSSLPPRLDGQVAAARQRQPG